MFQAHNTSFDHTYTNQEMKNLSVELHVYAPEFQTMFQNVVFLRTKRYEELDMAAYPKNIEYDWKAKSEELFEEFDGAWRRLADI